MESSYFEELKSKFNVILEFSQKIQSTIINKLNERVTNKNFSIEYRIKTLNSLEYKIESKYPIPKSILEIEDLMGFRIISTTESEQNEIITNLQSIFKVLEIKDTSSD